MSHDSVSQEEVIKHASSCRSCSVRLQEEQLLSWSLGEIAGHLQNISPSLAVEQAVMKAFDRERYARQRDSRKWPRYATAAIAAALLLMATISFALLRRRPAEAAPDSRSPNNLSAAVATLDIERTAPPFKAVAKRQRKPGPATRAIPRGVPASEAVQEIATDFIRVNYAASIEPGAQMVRVQLPRSAMTQFGLPVNMDRADRPVKADVIMGIDGIAQAIRFVQ